MNSDVNGRLGCADIFGIGRLLRGRKIDEKSLDKDGFSYSLRDLMMEGDYDYGESM